MNDRSDLPDWGEVGYGEFKKCSNCGADIIEVSRSHGMGWAHFDSGDVECGGKEVTPAD